MVSVEHAIEAERAGRIEEAARAYEEIVRQGNPSIEVLTNLLVLYWQASDYAVSLALNLPLPFVTYAGERMDQVGALAAAQYPWSTGITFWRSYIAWIDRGEPLSAQQCVDLLARDPAVLDPALYLVGTTEGTLVPEQAVALVERARTEGTLKAQYIVSVIEGVLTREAQRVR